jgi:uncharacterized protein
LGARRHIARAAIATLAACAWIAAASAQPPFSRGLLFRLDRSGSPPSFIYGTMHSDDPRVVALPPLVQAAFDRAHRLALEIVLVDAGAAEFLAAAQFDDGRRLADMFDSDTVEAIRVALAARVPPEAEFDRLKPWAVLLLLAQPRDVSSRPTLERELMSKAEQRRRGVIGLESLEEQVAALDSIPVASQTALVRWALAHRTRFNADHERAINAWLARDLGELDRLAREPGRNDPLLAAHFDALSRQLVEGRSALMAHRLFFPLREGRVFVAVGALHLYGAKGMLALLREQGYRVTRVY